MASAFCRLISEQVLMPISVQREDGRQSGRDRQSDVISKGNSGNIIIVIIITESIEKSRN